MGVGPSTKETTLHHMRDPLVEIVQNDKDVDLVGIAVVGSPQDNLEKFYVAKRLGMLAEALGVDGVLIYAEGFGNQHVDFAAHIEELGKRGIPVVGLTFAGNGLVVENEYMEDIIDLDKAGQGMETEVVGQNCVVKADAVKSLKILKQKMKKKRG
ncbi:glycine/sarcosine/betaine reductase component B subunit [Thermosediminibacter oceani]|uniref:D-proline reductase (Dithiol) n=1 Tax=Thermosediminibacter oceani (strain ATCC BAA-1034 / DSM 16646 / JW/IW-1228P) TaxID=555079 RepID=D9RYJ0_THEOJ|nr:glycine/sarcosine/betaine reductase component B subunit [Thermosediminibacter oceani]ADL08414.1 D-proline reductase (dithiol) [Thermosediminibacter oceani DSM 16646]